MCLVVFVSAQKGPLCGNKYMCLNRLTTLKRVLEETVLAALFSKTKNMEDKRPDYFHLYPKTNMALHGEFDENKFGKLNFCCC